VSKVTKTGHPKPHNDTIASLLLCVCWQFFHAAGLLPPPPSSIVYVH